MQDAEFIIGLMRTATDALGFIPAPDIKRRWVARRQYILQLDRHGRKRGYLLHGPPHADKPLHINQAVIQHEHRLRGYATLALRELLERAHAAGSTEILLRCAADLEANAFWLSSGFTPYATLPGGKRRNRQIIAYRLKLPKLQTPIIAFSRPIRPPGSNVDAHLESRS